MKKYLILLFSHLFSFISYSQTYNGELLDYLICRYDTVTEKKLDVSIKTIDDIYSYIKKQKNTIGIDNKWINKTKIYENGVQTAINNSKITKFYVAYSLKNNKSFEKIEIPYLDTLLYQKLNDVITNCVVNDNKDLMVKFVCLKLMDLCLFYDYFNIGYQYGNFHDVIWGLSDDKNVLYFEFMNKNSYIFNILEYSVTIPLIRMMLKYIYYQ